MIRWWFVAAGVFGLALGLGRAGSGEDVAASIPMATSLAAKVPPDVEGLAALAAVGSGPEAFEAALKLRTVGDERAVESLAKVLAEHLTRRSTAIHGFAAAQALFCIDTPPAREALSRYLLSSEYRADMGIRYAFHWEMPPEKRDKFIQQYHLTSTSGELTLDLHVDEGEGGDHAGRLEVTLTVCNVSDKPLRVCDPKCYQGNMLVLRMKDGHFVNSCRTVDYKLPPAAEAGYGELPPGKCRVYRLSGQVREDAGGSWSRWQSAAGGKLIVDFGDVWHFIGRAGTFEVQAMLCSASPHNSAGGGDADKPWCGRVVSQSVEIEITPVVPGR